MADKEKVEIRKMQAEADAIYIDRLVADPDEIRKSRFEGAEYSYETQVDNELRAEFDKQVDKDDA